MDIEAAEAQLGLTFKDKTLLQRALTHRSYLNENPNHPLRDNERLEFLGDAVLDFITGEFLFHRFPEMEEGELTSLRSALVRTETLAKYAQHINLGNCIAMGKGEAVSGGRARQAILCGAFEALIGALYLDQGIDVVTQFVMPLHKPEIQEILDTQRHRDPKSLLQELAQGHYKITPTYKNISAKGPDHAKSFTIGAYLDAERYGEGSGPNKQLAAQAAAQAALERLQREMKNRGKRSASTGS
ncbi:MAG TPA: ribonuclease III [Chloroflexi bacterium]|nr:ribonuclease III [Chloroflexota bacterium]